MKQPSKRQQETDDRAFILDPNQWPRWPRWPFLPVKRRNNSLEERNLGVLYDNGRFVVYHVYLFGLPRTVEEFKASPKTEYPNVDALLADGWRVD